MRLSIYWSKSTSNCGKHISSLLDSLQSKPECILIGMQGGLSIQIESWAEENDVPVERYFPRYDVNGEQSRMVRDRQLIDNSTILLVVWDGRDASCKALIDAASESGLKCLQLNPLSDKKAIKSKKITLSEIRVLKDKAAKNSGMMSIPSEIILLLIDAIERRDFVLKKLSGK